MDTLTTQDFSVLQTRLFRPQIPGSLLVRSRLVEMLDFAPPKALTVVTAPAGFGKTTLVSSRLDDMQCSDGSPKTGCLASAWLAIDEQDHNFLFFLRHFIAALRKTFPGEFPETYKLLYNASEINYELILLVLTNEIAAFSQRFVMVFDDFHRADCPQLLALLSSWIKHWPLPLHLVIISRTQPLLPLAGLKSQGKINDIRSRDLRFSSQEAKDYINRATNSDPGETRITDLVNRIEGWVAGLKLLSIALNKTNLGQDTDSLLDLGKQDMINYLGDEVLGQMTVAMQQFLMKISILEALNAPLCLALVGQDELDESVEHLLDNIGDFDLFITSFQGKKVTDSGWFHMHHLMRDLLQKRLEKAFSSEQIKMLHLRALNWYADHNLFEEALNHALKAGEDIKLLEIVDQAIFAAFDNEDNIMMTHLLQFVKEEVVTTCPQFLFYKAWLSFFSWDINAIKEIARKVEKMIKSGEKDFTNNQDILLGQLAYFKGFIAYSSNNYKDAVKFYKKALDSIPLKWNYARGITVFYLSRSIQLSEGTQKALAYLRLSFGYLDNRSDRLALNHIFAFSAIYLHDGDLKASENSSRLLLDKARENELLRKEGYALLLLGSIYYQWNKLDLAEQCHRDVYKLSAQVTSFQTKLSSYGLTKALLAQEKYEEALVINQELFEMELELVGQVTDLTQVERLRILIAQNQWREAEQWAEAYTKPFADALLTLDLEEPLIFKAKVLIARSDPKDLPVITEILIQYLEITSQTDDNRCKAEALALLALAESIAGNVSAARDLLNESLRIASRGNMIRLYLDLGTQMEQMLKQVATAAEAAEFVQDLLNAFVEGKAGKLYTQQKAESPVRINHEGIEPPRYDVLSLRETEVLCLLAEAISLQDIADRLFITYSTAKRHTVNIYAKLGVHSRWEAVSFARENGII